MVTYRQIVEADIPALFEIRLATWSNDRAADEMAHETHQRHQKETVRLLPETKFTVFKVLFWDRTRARRRTNQMRNGNGQNTAIRGSRQMFDNHFLWWRVGLVQAARLQSSLWL